MARLGDWLGTSGVIISRCVYVCSGARASGTFCSSTGSPSHRPRPKQARSAAPPARAVAGGVRRAWERCVARAARQVQRGRVGATRHRGATPALVVDIQRPRKMTMDARRSARVRYFSYFAFHQPPTASCPFRSRTLRRHLSTRGTNRGSSRTGGPVPHDGASGLDKKSPQPTWKRDEDQVFQSDSDCLGCNSWNDCCSSCNNPLFRDAVSRPDIRNCRWRRLALRRLRTRMDMR